jgi:hypothetical protein
MGDESDGDICGSLLKAKSLINLQSQGHLFLRPPHRRILIDELSAVCQGTFHPPLIN